MNFDLKLESSGKLLNLELMAQQIVEGFNSGYHKSPFHGFSSEFEEHKIFNYGESTKHIDWKYMHVLINCTLSVSMMILI